MVTGLLYISVGAVGIAAIGPDALAEAARTDVAPLVAAANTFDLPAAQLIVGIGGITAMLGVALNLLLGLSRVALAMGRRSDLPEALSKVDASGSPRVAVIAMAVAIAALALIGNVEVTWSFSAFTVLIYYAITNLAALRLPTAERLYSPLYRLGGAHRLSFARLFRGARDLARGAWAECSRSRLARFPPTCLSACLTRASPACKQRGSY